MYKTTSLKEKTSTVCEKHVLPRLPVPSCLYRGQRGFSDHFPGAITVGLPLKVVLLNHRKSPYVASTDVAELKNNIDACPHTLFRVVRYEGRNLVRPWFLFRDFLLAASLVVSLLLQAHVTSQGVWDLCWNDAKLQRFRQY